MNNTTHLAKHSALPPPTVPLTHLQIDFTHMPPQGPLKCMLVIVDHFSKWVKAFPCAQENANTIVKMTKEIID